MEDKLKEINDKLDVLIDSSCILTQADITEHLAARGINAAFTTSADGDIITVGFGFSSKKENDEKGFQHSYVYALLNKYNNPLRGLALIAIEHYVKSLQSQNQTP